MGSKEDTPGGGAHGKRATYLAGCRCRSCRAANTAMCRQRVVRSVADPSRADRAGHGKASTYSNHGCRCGACKAAHSARMAGATERKRST